MDTPVRWRDIAVPAYGPTVLVSIGQGAILPLVALSARDLGGSVGQSALIVALIGVGQLIGDLPAGALAARIGEQKALVTACAVDAAALVGAFAARSLLALAAAILVTGLAGAMFSLARQAYLTEAVPVAMRARALSTLGGTFRIGLFIGPFAAAAIVSTWGIGSAYAFAAIMSLAAAVLTAFLPDVTRDHRRSATAGGHRHRSVVAVLREHRRVLLTLGLGVLVISAARSTRQSIVPLWAESQGIDAATTSLIFGLSSGVDMLLFYPGGAIMDRFGRVFVAVPAMLVLGAGFTVLPLTHGPWTVGLVAAMMGLGNGISAGIVMTLGADASPAGERVQFLGGWRLCADLGNAGGPLVISAVSAVAPLAVAAVTMGLLTWVGSAWLVKWVPVYAVGPRVVEADRAPSRKRRVVRVRELMVWMDCEMTGLDLVRDELVEVAALVTDGELNVLGEGLDLIIRPSAEALAQMGDFVRNMHQSSGLLEQLDGGLSVAEAEEQTLDYLRQFVSEPRKAPLAGNSIGTDRAFLARQMPTLEGFVHYRNVDVSSLKELVRRWYPRVYYNSPAKSGNHRALADVQESIEELRYYRDAVLVPRPGPDSVTAKAVAARHQGALTGAVPAPDDAAADPGPAH